MRTRLANLAAVGLALAGPASLAAQETVSERVAVEEVSYSLSSSGARKEISQLVVPLALIVPLRDRFSFDVATAYARSRVTAPGQAPSTITGLTDTQLRASYSVIPDVVILTAGVNLPTGRSTAASTQFAAAENIANDFLLFPIGTMGAGLATTGGIAVARPLGSWNLGLGASFRHSSDFTPYQYSDGRKAHYQPGDEYRARLGVDGTFGDSRATLAATYSSYGDDRSSGAAFNTGNRLVLQGGYETTARDVGYALNVWTLTRTRGHRANGQTAPMENIVNARLGATFTVGGVALVPTLETRHLVRAAVAADSVHAAQPKGSGQMETLGLAARWQARAFTLEPSATYSLGTLDKADLTGWRAMLAVRFAP